MAATIARQSDSISAGCSGAIASTSWASSSVRDAPNTAARLTRSWARKSTWSPARDASAANSRAASIDQSSRGQPAGIGGGRVDADATRRRAPGVEHDHHAPVAFGPPGADHDVGAARGGAPVDRAHVVADDILTQRVEFGSLPAYQRRQQPVDLAQLGKPRRQVLARQERRQHPDLTRHRLRTLPSRQPQRPDRSGRDTAARWSPRRTGRR